MKMTDTNIWLFLLFENFLFLLTEEEFKRKKKRNYDGDAFTLSSLFYTEISSSMTIVQEAGQSIHCTNHHFWSTIFAFCPWIETKNQK